MNPIKDFLNRSLAEKLVPKCLRLKLELKIGNYHQELIDTRDAKLKSFSLTLMKDIQSYCDKLLRKPKKMSEKLRLI